VRSTGFVTVMGTRAYARWGDRIAIAAYMGTSDAFDQAISDFSVTYADQNERDYQAFQTAARPVESPPHPASNSSGPDVESIRRQRPRTHRQRSSNRVVNVGPSAHRHRRDQPCSGIWPRHSDPRESGSNLPEMVGRRRHQEHFERPQTTPGGR
jgi:hypothetical protein